MKHETNTVQALVSMPLYTYIHILYAYTRFFLFSQPTNFFISKLIGKWSNKTMLVRDLVNKCYTK